MKKTTCPWCSAPESFGSWPSESAKYSHLVTHLMPPHLNVIEVGSGGWPCVPHALQVELSVDEFTRYTSGDARPPVQWRIGHADLMQGIGFELPFKDNVADVLYSSHVIEDVPCEFTASALREWARVLKPGGMMIVMHPDKEIWGWCISELGQSPNCEHRCERGTGDLGAVAKSVGLIVEKDELTNCHEHDYNILCIFRKP